MLELEHTTTPAHHSILIMKEMPQIEPPQGGRGTNLLVEYVERGAMTATTAGLFVRSFGLAEVEDLSTAIRFDEVFVALCPT